MKDWVGNRNSIYKTLGASNHSTNLRQNEDYYATEPKAANLLLQNENFVNHIWECACGECHLSKVLLNAGNKVKSTDLIDRGFGDGIVDFLSIDNLEWNGDIVTNPPYKYAQQFVLKALHIIPEGNKVAMFLKLQFLEGKARKKLFEMYPPKTVYVSSSRLECAMNGVFKNESAVAYAWFVWEKGFYGDTILRWIN